MSFVGCDQVKEFIAPRFDTTSMEAFEASVLKIKADLTPAEQKQLDDAIMAKKLNYFKDNAGSVIIGGLAAALDDNEDSALMRGVEQDFLKSFEGKTGRQIIRENGAQ